MKFKIMFLVIAVMFLFVAMPGDNAPADELSIDSPNALNVSGGEAVYKDYSECPEIISFEYVFLCTNEPNGTLKHNFENFYTVNKFSKFHKYKFANYKQLRFKDRNYSKT